MTETHGGARAGAGRPCLFVDIEVERARIKARDRFPQLSPHEIDAVVMERAELLGKSLWVDYILDPASFANKDVPTVMRAKTLIKEGLTVNEVSKILNVSKQQLDKYLIGNSSPAGSVDKDKCKAVLEMKNSGASITEIAVDIGLSVSTVAKIVTNPEFYINDIAWQEILEHGIVGLVKRHNAARQTIRYRGKTYTYAVIVWNSTHLDDPCGPDEEVHHLDGDSLNDDPSNLAKLTKEEHRNLHKQTAAHLKLKRVERLISLGLSERDARMAVGIGEE